MGNNQKYIGTSKAAELLGMTGRRIVGLIGEGKMNGAFRTGRNWKIPVESVRAYMEASGKEWPEDIETDIQKSLPLALGNSSFAEISGDYYYVDKTLLIKELAEDHSRIVLFSRPRRFGKTSVISMVRAFFEKTGEDTSELFKDKKIWQCGERYRRMQGKYPVIMLSFKDAGFNSRSNTIEAIRLAVRDEFRRHLELTKGEAFDSDMVRYIERLDKGDLSEVELSRSLMELIRALSAYHNSKAVVLIDEYDTPIREGIRAGFSEEVISFLSIFLSGGLRDNPALAFALLTGNTSAAGEKMLSSLAGPGIYTILDNRYSSYFGFTDNEVRDMAAYYDMPDALNEIRSWYGGYRFGYMEIYNPWSVTNYFASEGKARPYWAAAGDNAFIRDLIADIDAGITEDLISIIQGGSVRITLDNGKIDPRVADGADGVFSYLLTAGYLTAIGTPEENEFGTFVSVRVPNEEIRRLFKTEILGSIRAFKSADAVFRLEKAMHLNDEKEFSEALRPFLINSLTSSESPENERAAEAAYDRMALVLAASVSSKYYVRSIREDSGKKFTVIMEPKDNILSGICIELQAAPVSEVIDLSKVAESLLAQTEEAQYLRDFEKRGIAGILRYGVVFSGIKTEIASARERSAKIAAESERREHRFLVP